MWYAALALGVYGDAVMLVTVIYSFVPKSALGGDDTELMGRAASCSFRDNKEWHQSPTGTPTGTCRCLINCTVEREVRLLPVSLPVRGEFHEEQRAEIEQTNLK